MDIADLENGQKEDYKKYCEAAAELKKQKEESIANGTDMVPESEKNKEWEGLKEELKNAYNEIVAAKDDETERKKINQFYEILDKLVECDAKKTEQDKEIHEIMRPDVDLRAVALEEEVKDAVLENQDEENEKNQKKKKEYIFQKPDTEDVTSNSSDTIDGILTDSEKFINSGNRDLTNRANLQSFSQVLYNVLLTIAVAVSVIIGGILGIKLMTSSVEQKAEVKQLLIPYVVGCIAVFGAFGIWKLIVTFLQGL